MEDETAIKTAEVEAEEDGVQPGELDSLGTASADGTEESAAPTEEALEQGNGEDAARAEPAATEAYAVGREEEDELEDDTLGNVPDECADDNVDGHSQDRPQSPHAGQPPTHSERKTSLRTDALIHAAARAVVARIERQDHEEDNHAEHDGDHSILSSTASDTFAADSAELAHESGDSRRNSADSHSLAAPSLHGSEGGEGGDSSSHHDADDDVFSDHSPRSSLGSLDSGADDMRSKSGDTVQHNDDAGYKRSPRVSGVSNLSQYENEDFVPAARGTPRPAFRTPSAVRAIQMSSPTPSLYSSPRSSKRHTGVPPVSALPTISRLGSPTVSAQYSPKGRSTPRPGSRPRKRRRLCCSM